MPRKRGFIAIVAGVGSDGRAYRVAVPPVGPAWPLRPLPSGNELCRCRRFWEDGTCEHTEASAAERARTQPPADTTPTTDEGAPKP